MIVYVHVYNHFNTQNSMDIKVSSQSKSSSERGDIKKYFQFKKKMIHVLQKNMIHVLQKNMIHVVATKLVGSLYGKMNCDALCT